MSITISGTGAVTGVSTNYSFDKKVSIGGTVGIGSTALDVNGNISIQVPESGTKGLYIGNGTTTGRGLLVSNFDRSSADVNLLGLIGRWANNQVASILFQTGSDTANKKEGYIIFRTRDGEEGGIPTRMTLTKEGYLGIGNSGPSSILTIDNTTPIDTTNTAASGELGNVYLEMSSGGTQGTGNLGPSINFTGINQSGIDGRKAAIIAQQTGSNSSQVGLSFWTNNSSDSGGVIRQRMVISANGNIGIGTDGPARPLHIESTLNNPVRIKSSATYSRIEFSSATSTDPTNVAIGAFGDDFRIFTGTSGSNSTRMSVTSTGNVTFGDATATQITGGTNSGKFYQGSDSNFISCRATSASATHQSFFNSNGGVGSITTGGSSTNYNTSSDYRLKENVVDLDGAIDRVKQLAPRRFNFIADVGKTVDGFLAHEVQAVVPESVTGTKDEMEDIGTLTEWDETVLETNTPEPDSLTWDETITDEDGNETVETRTRTWVKTGDRPVMQGIDQAKLVPLLTAALQEAIAEIETLKTKVAVLEGN